MALGNILGGAAGGSVIAITIKAIDQYSKEFKKFDKTTKGIEKNTKNNTFRMIGWGAAIGAVVGAFVSLTKAGMEFERSQVAFNQLMGDAANRILPDMRKATRGLASDMELMNAANRAVLLGISKDQLPALMEVAAARARLMGISVSQAANDIATGIGRESRLILDNLGIILDIDKATEEYAKTLDKTSAQLTALERKRAITNAVIKESESIILAMAFSQDTASESMQRYKAAIDNVKNTIGGVIVEGIAFLQQQGQLQQAARESTGSWSEASRIYHDIKDVIPAVNQKLSEQADVLNNVNEEIKTVNDAIRGYKDAIMGISGKVFEGEREQRAKIAEKELEIAEIRKNSQGEYHTVVDFRTRQAEKELTVLRDELEYMNLQKKAAQLRGEVELETMDLLEVQKKTAQEYVDAQIQGILDQKALLPELIEQQTLAKNVLVEEALETQKVLENIGLTEEAVDELIPGMEKVRDMMKEMEKSSNKIKSNISSIGEKKSIDRIEKGLQDRLGAIFST